MVLNQLSVLAPACAGGGTGETLQERHLHSRQNPGEVKLAHSTTKNEGNCGMPCCDEKECPTQTSCHAHFSWAVMPEASNLLSHTKNVDYIKMLFPDIPERASPPIIPPPILT